LIIPFENVANAGNVDWSGEACLNQPQPRKTSKHALALEPANAVAISLKRDIASGTAGRAPVPQP
jgi:hypothetical protein